MGAINSREFNIDVIQRVRLNTELEHVQSFNRKYAMNLFALMGLGLLVGLAIGFNHKVIGNITCGAFCPVVGYFVGVVVILGYISIKSSRLKGKIKALDDKYQGEAATAFQGKCLRVEQWLSDTMFYDLTRDRQEETSEYYEPLLQKMLEKEQAPTELRPLSS